MKCSQSVTFDISAYTDINSTWKVLGLVQSIQGTQIGSKGLLRNHYW